MKSKLDDKKSNPQKNDLPHKQVGNVAHWDSTYSKNPHEKLGWFETDHAPTFQLIDKSEISSAAKIAVIGAGSTTLIDELIKKKFLNIIATDISEVSLKKAQNRVPKDSVEFIVDDLTHPVLLNEINIIDLWIDRAVLHFFTKEKEQETYFNLLRKKVRNQGFVLFAEFGIGGALKCSGLEIKQYDNDTFQRELGPEFRLIETFNHTYTTPSGATRAYIYSLFQRN